MTRRLLSIAGVAFILSSIATVSSAQLSSHYRGAARNSSLPHSPSTLEWSVFARSDSQTTGWLTIGPPLKGSGVTAAFKQGGDSVVLVTGSSSGDTIVWVSPTGGASLAGNYRVIGGQYAGESGEWSLRADPLAPTSLRVLAAALFGAVIVAAIYRLGKTLAPRFWRWRLASPEVRADKTPRNWGEVGGWLAWLVLGNVAVGIYLLATLGEEVTTLGDTWMLAAMVPGFRSALFVEASVHFLQLAGIILGLVLIARASPTAPTYWLIYYAAMIVYVFYDIAAVPGFKTQLEAALGLSLEAEGVGGTKSAESQNMRLAFNAAIWSLYWVRSYRVRVRFAPRSNEPAVEAPIIGEPSGA
jgi:hypothetical protein